MSANGFTWNSTQDPKDGTTLHELWQLYSYIGAMDIPPQSSFGFRFMLNPDGRFTVKTMRRCIDAKINPYCGPSIFWDKMVPLKVRCFIWRASLYRIPVATSLVERGISVPNQLCKFCNIDSESSDHLLVNCEFAKGVREWIFKWCGINTQHFSCIRELIDFATSWGNSLKERTIFNSIVYCLLWNIWIAKMIDYSKN